MPRKLSLNLYSLLKQYLQDNGLIAVSVRCYLWGNPNRL